jgi:two-component system CheB/CheR fusion protein
MASGMTPADGLDDAPQDDSSAVPSCAGADDTADTPRFPIVALGASAGGLEAYEAFFRALPIDSGMGYVLVQHLDPSHASMLVEILQRATAMPVVEAVDQMAVLPDRVHVIPPNRDLSITGGRLTLAPPAQAHGMRMPIDTFMRALADDQGDRAVGIVLSGTGTDGTLGLQAIDGAGGLCLVQAPATARYSGMPDSAIRTGRAHAVLAVDQMPQALHARAAGLPGRAAAVSTGTGRALAGLDRVLAALRAGSGHDFSLYKKSTIGRRVERRMAQHHLDDADAYLRFMKDHPEELPALFRELLINVTRFFRDPDAFEVLKRKVLPALLDGRPETYTLRIWVAGCATGEEVYSVAIVRARTGRTRLAARIARSRCTAPTWTTTRSGRAPALYPPNIGAGPESPERCAATSPSEDAGYRVRKEIREMVGVRGAKRHQGPALHAARPAVLPQRADLPASRNCRTG